MWDWERYNPPGLLVGPLPHRISPNGCWVPDYRHPGVADRVKIEVDFTVDQEPPRH